MFGPSGFVAPGQLFHTAYWIPLPIGMPDNIEETRDTDDL